MTSQIVKLEVSASIPIECEFWPQDDGWKGLSGSPAVTVAVVSKMRKRTWQLNYKPRSKKSCVTILRKVLGELPERLSTALRWQNHFICLSPGWISVST
jgi:hypothetical protein